MTGSQMLALQKQRKKCGGGGGGGKLLQLGLSFGYERLSNHVGDVVKAIQSLQTDAWSVQAEEVDEYAHYRAAEKKNGEPL